MLGFFNKIKKEVKHQGDQSKKDQTTPMLSLLQEVEGPHQLHSHQCSHSQRARSTPEKTKRNKEFLTLHYGIDYAKELI